MFGYNVYVQLPDEGMLPRVYTYKITFEEIPHWYWGVHKEKTYGEIYLGSPSTHSWMWEFYTPIIEILQEFPNNAEGWAIARSLEDRLIKPDLNNPLCLNEHCGGVRSLRICSEAGKIGGSITGRRIHEEKDERGKSVYGIKVAERLHSEKDELGRSLAGIKAAERLHKEKDELGRSIHGVKFAEKLNSEKDENGKSVKALKGLKTIHSRKDDQGRSINGVEAAERINSKLYRCLVTGKISTAGPLTLWQRVRGIDTNLRVRVE